MEEVHGVVVEGVYGTQYQSGSLSLIVVGSDCSCSGVPCLHGFSLSSFLYGGHISSP